MMKVHRCYSSNNNKDISDNNDASCEKLIGLFYKGEVNQPILFRKQSERAMAQIYGYYWPKIGESFAVISILCVMC